jgi:hemerythrin-like domain-containing protein
LDGIRIAQLPEAKNMEAKLATTHMTPCSSPLPGLEVPMINTMVMCLGIEHKKLNGLIMQLACAATRLASDPGAVNANQRALQVWNEIRQDLWSHLQIEDELVFSWGKAHHAISGALLDTLNNERQEMRKLMTALRALSPGVDREPQTAGDRSTFTQTLLALARMLDSHVERYDGEVLPSILRALFHR